MRAKQVPSLRFALPSGANSIMQKEFRKKMMIFLWKVMQQIEFLPSPAATAANRGVWGGESPQREMCYLQQKQCFWQDCVSRFPSVSLKISFTRGAAVPHNRGCVGGCVGQLGGRQFLRYNIVYMCTSLRLPSNICDRSPAYCTPTRAHAV